MSNNVKERIYSESRAVLEKRQTWLTQIANDDEFICRGGKIYPYDTIGANIDPLFELIEKSNDFQKLLTGGSIRTICDIGCANGDLSIALARAGFNVTAVDYSFGQDQATYVVSKIAQIENISLPVSDMSVDRYFDMNDIRSHVVNKSAHLVPEKFDLVICVGVIYHLKNPFSFLESLAKISKYAIVGTHLLTHTPNLDIRLDKSPM